MKGIFKKPNTNRKFRVIRSGNGLGYLETSMAINCINSFQEHLIEWASGQREFLTDKELLELIKKDDNESNYKV